MAQERPETEIAGYNPQDSKPNEDVEMHEQPAANEVVEDKLDVE